MITDRPKIHEALLALGPVYVQIAEYRRTHAHLHVLLTANGFRRELAHIWLADCFYISGPTSGGPWALALAEETSAEGRALVLKAGDHFVAKAMRAAFELTADSPTHTDEPAKPPSD